MSYDEVDCDENHAITLALYLFCETSFSLNCLKSSQWSKIEHYDVSKQKSVLMSSLKYIYIKLHRTK